MLRSLIAWWTRQVERLSLVRLLLYHRRRVAARRSNRCTIYVYDIAVYDIAP